MDITMREWAITGILSISILCGFSFIQEVSLNAQEEDTGTPQEQKEEAMSLDLKGVEIGEIFKILSMKTGLTIVPAKSVMGRINIFLNNVKFEDALDIILVTQNLAIEQKGNIVYVMTADDYLRKYGREYVEKRQYKSVNLIYAKPAAVFAVLSELKSAIGKVVADEASGVVVMVDVPEHLAVMEEAIKKLDVSLETITVELNYADPEEVKAHLAELLTPGVGVVIEDKRSSKVIVSDTPTKIIAIRAVIEKLDEEEKQVFIEAEIVQVALNDEFSRGIDWTQAWSNPRMDGLQLAGNFLTAAEATTDPVLSVGTVSSDSYTLVMDFVETYGEVKILSRPRIAVVNNQEAKILVGTREAYVTQSLSQSDTSTVSTEAIEFVDVGVKLNVTPTINEDGFVILKIKPEVSEVLRRLETELGSEIPIIATSEAETTVKIKDGTMIMIAGLIKEETRDSRSGLPYLAKIPILGSLFGSRTKETQTSELIVFITPHIITGEYTLDSMSPEKIIPAGLIPEDMKKYIIERELEKIKPLPEPEEKTAELEKIDRQTKQKIKPDSFSKTAVQTKQEDIKGLKSF